MPSLARFIRSSFLLPAALLGSLAGCASAPARQERIALELFRQEDADRRLAQWPVPYRELRLKTRFGATYAIESGPADGPAVILVHAMGFNALAWAPNVGAFAAGYRTIAVDTIGDQGRSVPRRDYPQNGKEYAAWLSDVMDSLSIDSAVLVGCSMGAWIVLNAAIENPGRVDALVLNSPAAGLPVKTTWMKYLNDIIFTSSEARHRKAARFLLGGGNADRDWEDYMVRVVADAGAVKLGMPGDLSDEALSALRVPVLLLVGDGETIYESKEAFMEKAKSYWPHAVASYIPRAGHMGHYDNPDYFDGAALDFLASIGR